LAQRSVRRALAEAESESLLATLRLRMRGLPDGAVQRAMTEATAAEMQLSAGQDGAGIKERVASRLQRLEAAAGRRMARGTGLLATIDHWQSRAAVTAERGLLATLEAGCSAPVGAYAALSGTQLRLDAVVLGEKMIVREHGEADATDAARLGRELAAQMLALGAADLVGGNTDRNDAHD